VYLQLSMLDPLRVFISSTCRDLADLRQELRVSLEGERMSVRISEDVTSDFTVDPRADSITSCLRNVDTSDVVLLIADHRYGWVLPREFPDYGGLSAVHAEYKHAREKKIPTFLFIREPALADYHRLAADPDARPEWIDHKDAAKWRAFVAEIVNDNPGGQQNWYDTFRTSVDLKAAALRRLTAAFPQHAGSKALLPDRLVRLTFNYRGGGNAEVYGEFRNVGVGPALDITHWLGFLQTELTKFRLGGLREGDAITTGAEPGFHYVNPATVPPTDVRCEYRNRFGDRYRIVFPVERPNANSTNSLPDPEDFEKLFVWVGDDKHGEWIEIK
jgi:hypothetical protein